MGFVRMSMVDNLGSAKLLARVGLGERWTPCGDTGRADAPMERIRTYARFGALILLVTGLSGAAVSTAFAQEGEEGANVIVIDHPQNQEGGQDQDVDLGNTSDLTQNPTQELDQDLEQGVWFQAGGAGDTTLADTYVASGGNQSASQSGAQDAVLSPELNQTNDQSNANDQILDQEQNATNTGIIFDNDDYSDDDINIYVDYVEVNIDGDGIPDSTVVDTAVDAASLSAELSAQLNQILAGLLAGGATV